MEHNKAPICIEAGVGERNCPLWTCLQADSSTGLTLAWLSPERGGTSSTPLELLSLDFLLQRRLEQPKQQVLLPLVGCIIVEREDDRVHEFGGLILGHLKDQLGQVCGVGLKQKQRVNNFQI